MKKLILGSLIAATFAALPAAARTNVDFVVNFGPPGSGTWGGPPALRYEYVPAPRAGFIWVPGYWDWRYSRYHWVGGHWSRHRHGYFYEPVRWVHRGGRYYRYGGWRDSDRDGVPNRYDYAPHDPYRR